MDFQSTRLSALRDHMSISPMPPMPPMPPPPPIGFSSLGDSATIASVAGLILTTDAMVAEHPKDEKPMGGGGGMGGMGGMGDMDM